MRWIACLSVLLAVMTARSEPIAGDGGAVVTLTEEQQGESVELVVGETFEIVLPGNPTTGYRWECTAHGTPVLAPAAEPDYLPDSQAIGAGGRFIFRFQAVAAGETTVRLIYRRPWEKETAPLKSYEVTVAVRP